MKNSIKLLGIAVLVTVIGLATIGCTIKDPAETPEGGGNKVAVTGVTLNKTTLLLKAGGTATDGTETLTATVAPANATNKNVTWKSNAESVATVSTSGVVTAVAAGTAKITVTTTDGNKTADCAVTVTKAFVEMVSVSGGSFQMGSNDSLDNGASPPHTVTLSAFYIGKYEVTQEQYKTVMGSNPSDFSSDPASGEVQEKRPVEQVSWYDAVEFCNKLSVKESLQEVYTISGRTPASGYPITSATVTADFSKNGYRLPTEAQWEYACRAGTTTAYNTGDTISDNTGWYKENSESKTHEVGKKSANAWGLYDMHGNVYEWCWDWYGDYSSGAQTNPMGASSGSWRVVRGGCWNDEAKKLRSAYRNLISPSDRGSYLGVRVVRP